MVSNAEIIAFRLDVLVDYLEVEELGRVGIACDAPIIEVEQAAKERELPLLIQHLDLHEVGEVASKVLHSVMKFLEIRVDLSAQENFGPVARKLRLQLAHGAVRVSWKALQCGHDARLRARTFKDDHVNDLNVEKLVSLRFEVFAPLVYGRVDDLVSVAGEGNLGPTGLEEILVDVEAFA